MPSRFPNGVAIFFRTLASSESLARSFHPTGRSVTIGRHDFPPDDYVVWDENGELLGVYPRDFVAAIMPILTIGPAGV